MPLKPIVRVHHDEKQLYRIFSNIVADGEARVTADDDATKVTLTTFGKKTIDITREGLLEPIWRTRNFEMRNERLIRVPKNVEVIEKKGNGMSLFHFKRRKIG